MENSLAVLANRPAYLAEMPSQNTALTAGIGLGFPHISIKQSVFRIKQGDTETPIQNRYLDIVIVAAKEQVAKTFYIKQWQPGDAEAPDCASSDGITPDAGVPFPQSATCATCPQAQWGSKISALGKQIKACSDSKKVVILPAQSLESELCLLSIPPASLKAIALYGAELAKHGVPASAVVTRMEFDLEVDYPKLKFTAVSYLPEAEARRVAERATEPMVDTILGAVKRPAPVLAAQQPAGMVFGRANPVGHPDPAVYAAPAPAPAPAPVYAAPAPVQAAPAPIAPAPVYAAPAPAPVYAAPAPTPVVAPAAAPAASAVSAFGGTPIAAVPDSVPTPPANGGEMMPPAAVAGDALASAVAGILGGFDDE